LLQSGSKHLTRRDGCDKKAIGRHGVVQGVAAGLLRALQTSSYLAIKCIFHTLRNMRNTVHSLGEFASHSRRGVLIRFVMSV
jgi:hypothetical protein